MTRAKVHRATKCPHGCGPIVVPIFYMPRGYDQAQENPAHNVGCPACGRTWQASAEDVAKAQRAEDAYTADIERDWKRAEKQRKADELRARLAAAPKARP